MARIYPDLDEIRRCSESIEKPPYLGKVEFNCEQIFTKGAKGFVDRAKRVGGYAFRTGQIWVLTGLTLLFFISFSGTIVMWFTNMFDNAVLSNMVLANNSAAFELWRKPPVKVFVKIHIFNYTNLEEYEKGDAEKLHVQDVGPYVYEQQIERVNVKFTGEDTVNYQEYRTFRYLPHLSHGRRQSDRITVPNLPMLGAASMSKYSYYLTRLSMSTLLKSLNAKPFIRLPAHRFIWGYDDNLYSLAKGVLAFTQEIPYDKFGILANKNGTNKDVITINTGAKNIDELGKIKKFNGEESIGYWSTQDCNRIQGSDGTIFPPRIIRQKKPVDIYLKDMCRRLPFVYSEEVEMFNGKIPAYRYLLPDNIFDHPEIKPENQCYCDLDSGDCPPQGVFNSTPCAFGAPAFISFPHFYMGDPSLKEAISGLNPNSKDHGSYLDIHPKYGFAMRGRSRFQMNIQVRKSFGMTQLDGFEDGMMLPVAWIDMSVDEKDLTEEIVDLIFFTTYTVPGIEIALKYGCLLSALVTLIPLLMVLKSHWQSRRRANSSSSSSPLESRNRTV